jgi:hypothetical protein
MTLSRQEVKEIMASTSIQQPKIHHDRVDVAQSGCPASMQWEAESAPSAWRTSPAKHLHAAGVDDPSTRHHRDASGLPLALSSARSLSERSSPLSRRCSST